MPEESLKQCLFEHTRKYQERYETFKKMLGENHEETIKSENKYYGCHLVICDAGLENEYEAWLKDTRKGE